MNPGVSPFPYWRLSGYYFVYFAFIGVFSPYFGLYLADSGFSSWEIGLLMSQMQLMRLLGPNVWGWLADSYGQRVKIIRLAALLGLLGFSGFLWFTTLPPMLLAMAILAFFWSAALPLMEGLTFDHLRDQHAQYSRVRLWGSVGFIVAVMATGAVLDVAPPRSVLWVCCGVLALIFLLACLLPEAPARKHAALTQSVRDIVRLPAVRALLLASFAMSAAHGAMYIFYSIHLDAHGYTKTEVGLLWSLGVLAEIVVFLFMARLTRQFSLRWILLLSFAAAILRFVLMGWGVSSMPLMLFVQLLHGLTFGACHAASVAAINAWFPGRAQGRGQALYSSISFGAGGLLGGLIAGACWTPWGAGWVFTLSAGFAALGFWLIWAWFRQEPVSVVRSAPSD